MNKGINNCFKDLPIIGNRKLKKEDIILMLEKEIKENEKSEDNEFKNIKGIVFKNIKSGLENNEITLSEYKQIRRYLLDIKQKEVIRHEATIKNIFIKNKHKKQQIPYQLKELVGINSQYTSFLYNETGSLIKVYGLHPDIIEEGIKDEEIRRVIVQSYAKYFSKFESTNTNLKAIYTNLKYLYKDLIAMSKNKRTRAIEKLKREQESFLNNNGYQKRYYPIPKKSDNYE